MLGETHNYKLLVPQTILGFSLKTGLANARGLTQLWVCQTARPCGEKEQCCQRFPFSGYLGHPGDPPTAAAAWAARGRLWCFMKRRGETRGDLRAYLLCVAWRTMTKEWKLKRKIRTKIKTEKGREERKKWKRRKRIRVYSVFSWEKSCGYRQSATKLWVEKKYEVRSTLRGLGVGSTQPEPNSPRTDESHLLPQRSPAQSQPRAPEKWGGKKISSILLIPQKNPKPHTAKVHA